MSVVIPRKYFHTEVIDMKLAEMYMKIKDCHDNFYGYKFNRDNICKGLLDSTQPEATIDELRKALDTKEQETKQTLERLPYFMAQIDKWEAIKAGTDDIVVDDLDEIEALIK